MSYSLPGIVLRPPGGVGEKTKLCQTRKTENRGEGQEGGSLEAEGTEGEAAPLGSWIRGGLSPSH